MGAQKLRAQLRAKLSVELELRASFCFKIFLNEQSVCWTLMRHVELLDQIKCDESETKIIQIYGGSIYMTTTSTEAIEALERIKVELKDLMPQLSKWRVEELRTLISEYHEKKWVRRRFPKYGALNKGFTETELKAFLDVVDEPRQKHL